MRCVIFKTNENQGEKTNDNRPRVINIHLPRLANSLGAFARRAVSPRFGERQRACFQRGHEGEVQGALFPARGGKASGWTAEYWQECFENKAKPGWKFMVEEPRSAKHNRMNIITDNKAQGNRHPVIFDPVFTLQNTLRHNGLRQRSEA